MNKVQQEKMSFFTKFQEKFSSTSSGLTGPHAQYSSYYCGQWHWMFWLAKHKPHAYLWRYVDWESKKVVIDREISEVEYLLNWD